MHAIPFPEGTPRTVEKSIEAIEQTAPWLTLEGWKNHASDQPRPKGVPGGAPIVRRARPAPVAGDDGVARIRRPGFRPHRPYPKRHRPRDTEEHDARRAWRGHPFSLAWRNTMPRRGVNLAQPLYTGMPHGRRHDIPTFEQKTSTVTFSDGSAVVSIARGQQKG